MVGVPVLKAERISRSGPKLSDAQTRNFEAIKYTCPKQEALEAIRAETQEGYWPEEEAELLARLLGT